MTPALSSSVPGSYGAPSPYSDGALLSAAAPQAPSKGKAIDPEATRKAAQDFESFFLTQSFETMYQGIGSDSLFGGGSGEQVVRSLLLQEYGKIASQSGGLGITDSIQREMIHLQEVQK